MFLADAQPPTLWLPAGLIAGVLVAMVLLPWRRRTKAIVGGTLVVLIAGGYLVLPGLLDVDRWIGAA